MAMSPAVETEAIQGFLSFLVLTLLMMIFVIIRVPAPVHRPAAEDGTSAPPVTPAAPMFAPPVTAVAPRLTATRSGAAAPPPASALGQPGRARPAGARYTPRHAPDAGRGTIRRSKVSGSPPWGPAPMPPGGIQ